jgi:hypothetical protein
VSAYGVVENEAIYVAPDATGRISLRPEFRALARNNRADFLRRCGDSFVSAKFGGAELSAFLTFRTHSFDEQRKIKADVEGSGFGMEFKASTTSTMKNYSEKKQLDILFHQSGGSGVPLPTTHQEIVERIRELATAARTAPRFYQIEVTRYDTLPNWPRGPESPDVANYGEIASQYEKFESLREQVQSILANRDAFILFSGVSIESLRDLDDVLLKHLQRLRIAARECSESIGAKCKINSEDTISDYEYRIRMPGGCQIFCVIEFFVKPGISIRPSKSIAI